MENPFVSVVILTLGPAKQVVDDLCKQTYKNFEIVYAREKGIVHAMNEALEACSGEIMVRVDDDVRLPEKWLQELIKPFKRPEVGGSTGPTFVPKDRRGNRDSIKMWENPGIFLNWLADDDPYAKAKIYKCGSVSYGSNYEEHVNTYEGHDFHPVYTPDHLEGTNWAMRTDLIKAVGGFDEKFDGVAEWFDADVEAKVKKMGYKLAYNPKAYLYHMLEFSANYSDRFDGWGRIKNWLRYHWRHSKFHPKMVVFLIAWMGYFIWRRFKK